MFITIFRIINLNRCEKNQINLLKLIMINRCTTLFQIIFRKNDLERVEINENLVNWVNLKLIYNNILFIFRKDNSERVAINLINHVNFTKTYL